MGSGYTASILRDGRTVSAAEDTKDRTVARVLELAKNEGLISQFERESFLIHGKFPEGIY